MRKGLVLFCLSIFTLLISGCDPETPPPPCPAADLAAPELYSPDWWEVLDGNAVILEWEYPDPACEPEGYQIILSKTRDFSVIDITGGTGNPNTSWMPADPLEPATEYFWRVAAMHGATVGPYSQELRSFFTDPICDPAAQVAPELSLPADGVIFERGYSSLEWTYPDPSCIPASYRVELSTTPDFSDTSLFGATGNPSTRWGPGEPLEPATQYYWRVAPFTDGILGPYSNRRDFFTDPWCGTDEIPQPTLDAPGPYQIVTELVPILEWSNPGLCLPESYLIHLSPDHDFSDMSLSGATGTPGTSWSPGSSLEPATQYWWEVGGSVGSTTGMFSDKQSFFTGPECASLGEVTAPVRLTPEDGDHLDSLVAKLHYAPGDPGCIPDGYSLNLQTDPTFGGTNLLTDYSLPGTTVFTDPLVDCTVYYWKVAAIQDGSYGAFSDVGWFFTNDSGLCVPPFIPGLIKRGLNCRRGVHKKAQLLAAFPEGQIAEAVGRGPTGEYLAFRIPGTQDFCWALGMYFEPWADLKDLEVRYPPPTPTPLVCSEDLSEEACEKAGGEWKRDPDVVTHVKYYCDCP